MDLISDGFDFGWIKIHPYNMERAYGSTLKFIEQMGLIPDGLKSIRTIWGEHVFSTVVP